MHLQHMPPMRVEHAHAVEKLCLGVLWVQQSEPLVGESKLVPIEAEDEEAAAAGLKLSSFTFSLASSASLPLCTQLSPISGTRSRRRDAILSTIQHRIFVIFFCSGDGGGSENPYTCSGPMGCSGRTAGRCIR